MGKGDVSAVFQPERTPQPARLLPLLADADLERTLAWRDGRAVSARAFVAEVHTLAAQLPPARYAVNLCEDRYRFLVAFCAVAVAGQTNLLPAARVPQAIVETLQAYSASYALADRVPDPVPPRLFLVPSFCNNMDCSTISIPMLAADQVVAIGVLHIDRPLECRAIVEPEELVSVAGEAVTAGHLAAAVWIDGPAEGHRPCVELVHEVLGTKLVILNAASLVKRAAESLGHAGRGNTRLHHGIRPHRHVLSVAVERKARGNGSPGSFSTCLPAPPSAAAATGPWPTVAARAASPCPLRLWPRLVDDEVSVPEEPTVQHLHCLASLFLGRHLDEPESARPSGELVRDDSDRFHGAGLLEELAKVLLGGLEG